MQGNGVVMRVVFVRILDREKLFNNYFLPAAQEDEYIAYLLSLRFHRGNWFHDGNGERFHTVKEFSLEISLKSS